MNLVKRIIVGVFVSFISAAALGTTPSPVSLLNTAGSTAGQVIGSSGPASIAAWTSIVDSVVAGSGIAVSGATGNVTVSVATNGVVLGQLSQQAANTVLANTTGSTANVVAFSMPSCSTSVSALNWTSGTGFTCNTGLVTAATAASTYATIAQATTALAATGGSINGVTVGLATPLAGAFTTLSATGLITPTSTIGIKGTVAADNAQAGSVGEFIFVAPGSTALTSGASTNVTSQVLAAGDYDVSGVCDYAPAGTTTLSQIYCGISTTSASLGSIGQFTRLPFAGTAGVGADIPSPTVRVQGPTTVYLVINAAFAVSTATYSGYLRVRRPR